MVKKQEDFEKVLHSSYKHDDFIGFVKEFLNGVQIIAPYEEKTDIGTFFYYVKSYYHIGNYITEDNDKIIILSVNLQKSTTVERGRSMQRNFVKRLIENSGSSGAIVAFFTIDEPSKWRLSFIRMDYEFSKGKVSEKLTPAKRYSYLVGVEEPCTTALQRLFPIFIDENKRPNIDTIEDAFSVEKVTQQFFDQYAEKYHQVREFLESNEDFVIESQARGFTAEQFTKKLLGQIVFLYFIQKKGWLGVNAIPMRLGEKAYNNAFYAKGAKSREILPKVYQKQEDGFYRINIPALQALSDADESILAQSVKGEPWGSGPKDFMRQMFNGCISAGKNYFDDYLEPLFYTGLNFNRGENGFYPPLHRRIPFLNGGLFEQLDNYDWENNDFCIPNDLFSNKDKKGRDADGILDIFDRYNFTMSEDEPMEREVAIDPEMLGKVFERLLDIRDRKEKGEFYTPREIVHYMCQEALINYLTDKSGISEGAIRDFILFGDFFKDEDTEKTKKVYDSNSKYHLELDKDKDLYISEEIFSFKKNINRLKELDTLLENVKIADLAVGSGAFPLGMLNEIVRARTTLTAYLSIDMNNFEKMSFIAYGRNLYDLKVNAIKNNIFACDIEPSAVDIAKLRLWLSIVIDDEITENNANGAFGAHSKPRQLPNLECNILCGNSLIDEFKGVPLISKSDVLKNTDTGNFQYSITHQDIDPFITKLIELQDKLFFIKDHHEKEDVRQQIQDIYNQIIVEQLVGNQELIADYYESLKDSSSPFILWPLYFPRVFKNNGGFDIIIGNPPYIDSEGMVNSGLEWERDYIAKNYKYAKGNWDIYISFFERGLSLLNSHGRLIFITPDKWISKPFGTALRQGEIEHFIQVLEAGRDVFETAKVDSIVTMIGKAKQTHINVFSMKKSEGVARFVRKVEKSILNDDCALDIVFSSFTGYVEKMSAGHKVLGDYYKSENACATSDCYILKDILHSHESSDEYRIDDEYKVINTGTIGRYVPRWGFTPMKYLKDAYDFPYVTKEEFHTTFPKSYGEKPCKKKIIIKGLTLLDGTIDFEGCIVPGKSTIIIPIEDPDSLKLVGAYINSRLSIFYIKQRYSSSSYNGGITFTKDMINNLPWIELDNETRKKIISLVDDIISMKVEQNDADTSELERQIDEIYYDAFGFNDEEIKQIDEIFKK